jgi:hypothetical protein
LFVVYVVIDNIVTVVGVAISRLVVAAEGGLDGQLRLVQHGTVPRSCEEQVLMDPSDTAIV